MSDHKLEIKPEQKGWTGKHTVITFVVVFVFIFLSLAIASSNRPTPAPAPPNQIGSGVTDAGRHAAEVGAAVGAAVQPTSPAIVTPPTTTQQQQAQTGGITDGTYEVGAEIAPGKYKSTGSVPGEFQQCYWARLKGDDEFRDLITNHYGDGPTTVVIRPGDKYFVTNGCQGWSAVPS